MPAHRSLQEEGEKPADECISPYVYVGNNPILDPDGKQVVVAKSVWNNPKFQAGILSDEFK